ncbi:hypothetical protein EMPS_08241 [Entomortierella parvispora]|uniref:AN1-type domain-containing protein n=1 Tax=Entomortierella parvispora TaxID=205924 RepID=A0A9P3HG08_9FUNG|nr:hypothetical protein EMPS_08241 [Entomortierella parvispora]
MCSKCFREVGGQKPIQTDSTGTALTAPQQKQNLPDLPITHLAPAADTPPSSSTSSSPLVQAPLAVEQPSAPVPAVVPAPVAVEQKQEPSQQQQQHNVPSPTASSTAAMDTTPDAPAPGERAVQVNKGRCFMCRAKIPLAKQAINKCRCDYVFCDTHKATAKHDCDFDFAKMGKEQLTKANPKLNDKPRGGRSFTRLD